jgi:hypothetical protein
MWKTRRGGVAMGAWKAVFFLCVMAASSVAHAQAIANSFNELQSLVKPGDTIRVTSTDGAEITGRLVDLSSASLVLAAGNDRREWQVSDVARISQRRGDSLVNGALWGLAGGGSFGFFLGAAATAEGAGTMGEAQAMALVAAAFGAMGAGIGVGVDALIAKRVPIFERRSAGASVGVTPILNTGRRGARVSIRF